MVLCKFTLKIEYNNILAFFLFLFEKFSLLDPDPDPESKMNADPCGSGSTALDSTYLG